MEIGYACGQSLGSSSSRSSRDLDSDDGVVAVADLPTLCLARISLFLEPRQWVQFASCCRRLVKVALRNESIWSEIVLKHWPRCPVGATGATKGEDGGSTTSWRERWCYFVTKLPGKDNLDRLIERDPRVREVSLMAGSGGANRVAALSGALRAVEENHTILSVTVHSLDAQAQLAEHLPGVIGRCRGLRKLHLIGTFAGKYAERLCAALANCPHVESLCLLGCQISGRAAQTLARSLPNLRELSYFDVSHNELGDEAGVSLCRALESRPRVDMVNFFDCNLGDESARALASLMAVNRGLGVVVATANPFSDEGVDALLDALQGEAGEWIREVRISEAGLSAQKIDQCKQNKVIRFW